MSYVSFNTEEIKYAWEEKRVRQKLCSVVGAHMEICVRQGLATAGQRDLTSAVDVAHVLIANLMCEGHRVWGIRHSLVMKDSLLCFC